MPLLTQMPHRAKIGRMTNAGEDALGSNRYAMTVEQSNVACWQQRLNAEESSVYEKRGILTNTVVYFPTNPNVTERHRILITHRMGVAVANTDITDINNPEIMDVRAVLGPDASAGLGILFQVLCMDNSGASG